MAANEPPSITSPGETNTSTRAPTQLAVLLAGAGTPPLEAEQARLAPIRLWDAFALAPERSRLFVGSRHALFGERAGVVDLRHDALARVLRLVCGAVRQRIDTYEASRPNADLLRGLQSLSSARVEGALTSFDPLRGTARHFSAEAMLGSPQTEVDALEAPDAGVLRRVVALMTRGLMLEKPGTRGAGVVNDLGAVTLALSVMDVCANPRSALRAARLRLSKSQRLTHDEVMRVRDVGDALREILSHAVSSATTAGAQGRDLVKETILTPEAMDHLAVALARAVYDGLAPDDEHPLMVPGTGESDVFTVAPLLVAPEESDAASGTTLGRYNRIAFVALPYARLRESDSVARPDVRRAPRAAVLDESAFTKAREGTRDANGAVRGSSDAWPLLDALVDATDPRFDWSRGEVGELPARIRKAVGDAPGATHALLIVGPRSAAARAFVDRLARELTTDVEWQVLSPRASDHSLVMEPLEKGDAAGSHLRRSDVTRWLDTSTLRSIHWDAPSDSRVVVNAAASGDLDAHEIDVLAAMLRDIADRADPRGILLVIGAGTIRGAAHALDVLGHRPDLESGDVPLRSGAVFVVRTDAPLIAPSSYDGSRPVEESILLSIAEAVAPSPPLAEQAVRAMLLPPEARYRGHVLRLAALGHPSFAAMRTPLERAALDPWLGAHLRRTLHLGVASTPTIRAALSAGVTSEVLACLRHEFAVLVAEWEGTRERPHVQRLADVARGLLVEQVFAAHPRVALLATDALAARFAHLPGDFAEPASIADGLHASALTVRPSGTVYASDDAAKVAPLGFVFRGGGSDLYAVIEVNVGPLPARKPSVPHLELTWRVPNGTAPLSAIAAVISSLHELSRRWNRDSLARHATRENRITFAALFDVSIDNKLQAESLRCVLPLRNGAADGDTQRLAVDLVARFLDTAGGSATEWSAQAALDSKSPTTVALVGPMLLREFVQRWQRALRLLPRHFPIGAKPEPRYARAPLVALGADLGLAGPLLHARGIGAATANGRAVMARLGASATDVMPRVRELAGTLPMKTSSLEGPELDVIERVLAFAWFLHANFCTSTAGSLAWAPADAPHVKSLVEQHVDRAAVKLWLQRKSSRPESVERRVAEFLDSLEPTIVVEKH
jgi:hypothetical protein